VQLLTVNGDRRPEMGRIDPSDLEPERHNCFFTENIYSLSIARGVALSNTWLKHFSSMMALSRLSLASDMSGSF
jgi:hypothetical protein